MIYIDTSALLKLFHDEPESDAVRKAIASQETVIVSSLTRLESAIQLKAGWLAGSYPKARYSAYLKELNSLAEIQPFHLVHPDSDIFSVALAQDFQAEKLHLRTVDRLHLAIMEVLEITELMTNDVAQAAAAKALGYQILIPS